MERLANIFHLGLKELRSLQRDIALVLLITVLACFLGGIDPFGGHGRVVPVVLALIILQVLSSGLNLIGANQHLATAVWGLFLIAVMVLRWGAGRYRQRKPGKG